MASQDRWGREKARERYGSEGMKKMADGGIAGSLNQQADLAGQFVKEDMKQSPSNDGESPARESARKRLSRDPFEASSHGAGDLWVQMDKARRKDK